MTMNRGALLLMLCSSLILGGCASTPSATTYAELGNAGAEYSKNLSLLINSAEAMAIDGVSVTLIGRSALNTTRDPNINKTIEDQLLAHNENDVNRIAQYNRLRAHIGAMHEYFSLVSKYAGSDESEETATAFTDLTKGIDGLTLALTDQTVFNLTDDQKTRIGIVVNFVIDQRKRSYLQKRLKEDSAVLFPALQLHAEMFTLFEANMRKDFATIKRRQMEWLLTKPLMDGGILNVNPNQALKWMDDRKALLNQEASLAELRKVVKASNKFKKLLTNVIEGKEGALIKLDRFATSLEETKRVLIALKGGE